MIFMETKNILSAIQWVQIVDPLERIEKIFENGKKISKVNFLNVLRSPAFNLKHLSKIYICCRLLLMYNNWIKNTHNGCNKSVHFSIYKNRAMPHTRPNVHHYQMQYDWISKNGVCYCTMRERILFRKINYNLKMFRYIHIRSTKTKWPLHTFHF